LLLLLLFYPEFLLFFDVFLPADFEELLDLLPPLLFFEFEFLDIFSFDLEPDLLFFIFLELADDLFFPPEFLFTFPLFTEALFDLATIFFFGLFPNLCTFFLDEEADGFLFDPLLEDEDADPDDLLRLLLIFF
jgi:hypothetical protein